MMRERIARVVVEISLDREFDYRIPERLADRVVLGSRVNVPFGRSRAGGYVVGLADHSEWPELKEISSIIGDKPLLDRKMIDLARWMSEYYASAFEQAIRTVLPCAVRRRGAKFREEFFVSLADGADDVESIRSVARRAPRQAQLLSMLSEHGTMKMSDLCSRCGTTSSVLRALERKGLVGITGESVDRSPFAGDKLIRTGHMELFPEQENSLRLVEKAIETRDPGVVLIHGVTGSGKTEIYLQAIQYVLDKDMGAIVLVPEISLTPQTVERFRSRFGDGVAVLHSHLSDGERHDQWYRILDGDARIVVGARSALFAPVRDLGLIVVDEEHETSYKQSEAPRYNARDVAVMRGSREPCAVILGSASPSLESFHNAHRKKYALSVLKKRVDNRQMPLMRIVDMRKEAAREGRLNVLSRDLVEGIRKRMESGEQSILFLNRRGYATSLVCPVCGHVSTCDNCSVTMTYHKGDDDLKCHICGLTRRVPTHCPECRERTFKYNGVGTQRVESAVRAVFPNSRVVRMDSDTTRRKDSYEKNLGDFKMGLIDILIGTQMIAKGLHFPGVTLVGVIQADLSLHIPDFRAAERTFQLLVQVAGRAGRGDVPGEVIVQTFSPTNPAIQAARRLDYDGFVNEELEARRELCYPPLSHLTCLTVSGKDEKIVSRCANEIFSGLKLPGDAFVADPMPAPLAMIKGAYRYQIVMRSKSVCRMSEAVKTAVGGVKIPRNVRVAVDVDALSLM